jgi:2-polyprenyl-3-methyl-5-hydroxy-6-metoxy-1,4-benzoquinol methylase
VSEIVGDELGVEPRAANGHGDEPAADGVTFGSYYFQHDCGRPYERDDGWLEFFADVADQVIERLHPTSVLDAGCAWGFLVEALRKRGVDAWGVDVSEYAIAHVDDSVKEFCWQGSLVEPLLRPYDLVTCIEVIEHMPSDESDTAIANLCAASDRVLLSSTPGDYWEPTHLNVQPPENWAAAFARHGFVRDVDFDGSFLTPWAVLYVRSEKPLPEVVRAYERVYSRVSQERQELRKAILELQARLEALTDDPDARDRTRVENLRLAEELLASRDTVISHEVRLGDAMAEVRRLEAELVRYQERMEQLDMILRSGSWRISGALHRLANRLRRRSR